MINVVDERLKFIEILDVNHLNAAKMFFTSNDYIIQRTCECYIDANFFFYKNTREASKLIQIYSFVKDNQLCNTD